MTDVLIIGSGPAGLTAAIYAKRAGLDVLIAEREYLGTGRIAQTAEVDNYPGMRGISGYDLGEAMRTHAAELGTAFYDGEALRLSQRNNVWICAFDNGEQIRAKAVIYAAGCRYRMLELPGEAQLLGKKIHFCALCDSAFYAGKTVAVIGGSRTAAADALYLSTTAKRVLIICRGKALRAAQAEINAVYACENTEILCGTVPAAFEDAAGGVVIRTADGRRIEAAGVFEAVGMVPETELLKGLTRLDEGGFVIADESCGTDAAGLFAAGDVRTKMIRQVITACADGANAAHAAETYIKKRA